MTIRRMSERLKAEQKERLGSARLLRAVFEPAPLPIVGELEISSISPYSMIWNLIETNPEKWH